MRLNILVWLERKKHVCKSSSGHVIGNMINTTEMCLFSGVKITKNSYVGWDIHKPAFSTQTGQWNHQYIQQWSIWDLIIIFSGFNHKHQIAQTSIFTNLGRSPRTLRGDLVLVRGLISADWDTETSTNECPLGNHRKTIGKWWFHGIWWDLPSGKLRVCELETGHGNSEFPMNNGDSP